MLISKLLKSTQLLTKNTASIYIYLKNHNKQITPQESILNVSYRNPVNLVPETPLQPFIQYKIDPELQEVLDRQTFEQYKHKILRGIIDEQQEKQPDDLWGDEEAPVHYFNKISKIDLMRVSHPQNQDLQQVLKQHFHSYFSCKSDQNTEITQELIDKSDLHGLVELAMAARHQEIADRQIWYKIEDKLGRGKKLYLLSSEELVKLKWAFDNKIKQGSPIFHQILSSLIREDIPKMDKELCLNLFYISRYANSGLTNMQQPLLDVLKPMFKTFSFAQKSIFLLCLALCTKPLKFGKKVEKRRRYQFKQLISSLILQLDFWEMELNSQIVAQMVFSLAKLSIENTRFITYPLRDYISDNFEEYCEDKDRLFQAIVYLPELEAGQGVMDQQMAQRLREQAEARWDQFTNIEQIRMLHSLWNLGLMDESLLELYKQIQLQSDSTLLHYACQLELNNSSQRQWQIIQCLAHLQYIPLPYYTSYQRFHNYIKSTTEWNLTPVTDKLRNTEYYYDVMRQHDSLHRNEEYRKLSQFQGFLQMHFSQPFSPIQNLELAHYGFPLHKVSLDIVSKRQFIPGTSQLKESYLNKVRSLSYVGWKHLAFSEEQLQNLSPACIIQNIQTSFQPYIQSQKEVIEYEDYRRSVEIEVQKHMEEMMNWQLSEVDKFNAALSGEDYYEIGDVEEVDINNQDQIKKDMAEAKANKQNI